MGVSPPAGGGKYSALRRGLLFARTKSNQKFAKTYGFGIPSFAEDFMKRIAAARRSVRCLSSYRTDFPRTPAPGGPRRAQGRSLFPRSFGTMCAAGIGKFRKSCAGGAGTLSGQFRLRVLGHNVAAKPLSLLWKRETVSSLSKGKRRNGVGRLPAPAGAEYSFRRRRRKNRKPRFLSRGEEKTRLRERVIQII